MIFDLASRFKAAFGFIAGTTTARLINKGFAEIYKTSNNHGFDVFAFDSESTFDNITLSSGSDKYEFAYQSIDSDNNSVFATPPMFRLRRSKKLVVSAIDNSDTEVVERFTTNPWAITMKGLLIDMVDHNFPMDKLEKINTLFEANKIWNVSSEILDALNIEAIYIKDIDISFIEGYEDTIAYTITAYSIKPLEYQLINNN